MAMAMDPTATATFDERSRIYIRMRKSSQHLQFVYPLSLEFQRYIQIGTTEEYKDTIPYELSDNSKNIDLQLSKLSEKSDLYRLNVRITDKSGVVFTNTNVIRLSPDGTLNPNDNIPMNLRTFYVKKVTNKSTDQEEAVKSKISPELHPDDIDQLMQKLNVFEIQWTDAERIIKT
ncbi:unnamed protein product, partial [Rotaria sordida]